MEEFTCDNCGKPMDKAEYEDKDTMLCEDCCPDSEVNFFTFGSLADVRYLTQLVDSIADEGRDKKEEEGKVYHREYTLEGHPFLTQPVREEKKTLKPRDIHEKLDEYVIGQEEAKRVLSVAAYNHYKKTSFKSLDCVKSNILLIGPTGCGKTLLANHLAKILDVPFTIADATSLTQAGYVGEDVESILKGLLSNANNNLRKAEKGIVFIDEIDKLRKEQISDGKKDISGEGVQQALLKIMEGTDVKVETGSRGLSGTSPSVQMDTSNILFICSGSFAGMEKVINKRVGKKGSIGFGNNVEEEKVTKNPLMEATTEDIIEFGIIPEFAGRLPILACLEELTNEDMQRIITEPKDSILKQFTDLLEIDDVDLKFTAGAIKAIAEKAIKNGTGARGLRAIVEKILAVVMYEAPSIPGLKEVKITQAMVEKNKEPTIKIIK